MHSENFCCFLFHEKNNPGNNLLNWLLDTLMGCGPHLKNTVSCSFCGHELFSISEASWECWCSLLFSAGAEFSEGQLIGRKLSSLNEKSRCHTMFQFYSALLSAVNLFSPPVSWLIRVGTQELRKRWLDVSFSWYSPTWVSATGSLISIAVWT